MNEFVLIRMMIPPPFREEQPEPGHVLEKPKHLQECVLVSTTIGQNLWGGLARFLKKYEIEHSVRCRSVYTNPPMDGRFGSYDKNFGLYLASYILTIPNDAHAMFFKLHFNDQLVKAVELF